VAALFFHLWISFKISGWEKENRMKKITPILLIYILTGWAVLISQNTGLLFLRPPAHEVKQLKNTNRPIPAVFILQNAVLFFAGPLARDVKQANNVDESMPGEANTFDYDDKIAAKYISSGRVKDAINTLLDNLQKNAIYDDNAIIKNSSFNTCVNSIRLRRYLHTIDTLSLLFRLGERLKIPESQMTAMLSPYMRGIKHPESLQEYVVALECRLSYGHYENIDRLFDQFKKYLHSNFGVEANMPFLYYYPYLRGRFLLLTGKYQEAEQYLGLALNFRPDYSGITSSDLVGVYPKMNQPEKATRIVYSMLATPRETAEFMFFKSLYDE
jgi:tetratricopeptide (TPR) repeat protein